MLNVRVMSVACAILVVLSCERRACYALEHNERPDGLKAAVVRQLNFRMDAVDEIARISSKKEKKEFEKLERENATWDVDFYKFKYVMHIDLGYGEDPSRNIFTAAVFKAYSKEPPLGLTFTLPKQVDRKKGLIVTFAKKRGNRTQFKEADSYEADFSICEEEDCIVKLDLSDKDKAKQSLAWGVIVKMMKYDYMGIGFMENDELNTINIPLSYYQDKYIDLTEVKSMPEKGAK
jgi:hypothetical protein